MSRYLTSLADPSARAPLLCVLLLAALAIFQLALSNAPEFEERPAVATRLSMAPAPSVTQTEIPASILEHPIFAPRVSTPLAGAPGAVAPLGGASIAGVVTIGRTRYAIVRSVTGSIGHIRIGGRVAGWRIIALEQDGATLIKGAERLHLAYGAATPAVEEKDDSEEDSQ